MVPESRVIAPRVATVVHLSWRWAKQRRYPMRGFKAATAADTIVRGHAFIHNLRNGSAQWAPALTAAIPRPMGIMPAWSLLIKVISPTLEL